MRQGTNDCTKRARSHLMGARLRATHSSVQSCPKNLDCIVHLERSGSSSSTCTQCVRKQLKQLKHCCAAKHLCALLQSLCCCKASVRVDNAGQ